MLIRTMKTYLNIFKNCGAAQLEVELIFSITVPFRIVRQSRVPRASDVTKFDHPCPEVVGHIFVGYSFRCAGSASRRLYLVIS